MAYGRLDVYFPDGRLETHMLEEDTVSVGRADGNIVALDTDTISRYHFSIVRNDDVMSITDLESANGTFVDGVQLKSNEPQAMGDVEEILVGSLRIIFRQVDDSPTAMTFPIGEETQRVEVGGSELRVEIDYTTLEVWPAASSSTELSITNLSDKTREFSILLSGLPAGWLRITRPEIELSPNETAYILVNVKPPRRPNTVPQQYEVTVEVAPLDDPSLAVYSYIDVEINAYSGFGMAVGQQADEGEPVPVFLHNQGSGTMRFTLSAKDIANELIFQVPKTPLELQAGQRLRVDLHVDAKSPPIVGKSKAYSFIVQLQSHDASRFIAASDGKATIGARIPIWAAIAATGITLSILIIAFLALLGLLNPAEPEIAELSISSNQIAQGEELLLTIDASDVDSLDVLVNQVAIFTGLPGDTESLTIDTSDLSGNIEIAVLARNREQTAQSSISSYVYIPIAMNIFEVNPNPLVRNTVNTLTISWDIAGATFVRISGLSDFTNNLIQSSTEYGAVHTLEGIGGIPGTPLELTLYAEDEAGTSIEQSLTVALIDPQCTSIGEVPVHEGPDGRYQQVATVPDATTIVILAQDADAGWLRLQLPGDIRGWGIRESFDCAENFDLSGLRTEVNIPDLPTPLPPRPTLQATIEAPSAIAPTTVPRNSTSSDD